ncbi:SEC-C metal-binding domain-containing protein [Saccharibacillus alkalitolerans]|uniref:Preprotein translocase subunit SecA n=1 Tax=Saccharibacillus alkalitolerans TaxID=2705290 RepID=A0ABX0F297_9BACL|nr:SEC-C metal-binding domain-containing protein [Saccharibacillus alkalitolerans]NGZ73788.1 hypothetical protein [Saccharibacillus alkalitolerans]
MLYAHAEERMREVAGRLMRQMNVKRPGRNEPCLCGSGRKAKKCCGV